MKQLTVLAFVLVMTQSVTAQVTVRNDFVINGKEHKIKNRGITYISINLDRHSNLNYLMNGRGGNTLLIDVDALRHPDKKYTYTQIAEKVYVPNVTTGIVRSVPAFLLIAPPIRPRMNLHLFRTGRLSF